MCCRNNRLVRIDRSQAVDNRTQKRNLVQAQDEKWIVLGCEMIDLFMLSCDSGKVKGGDAYILYGKKGMSPSSIMTARIHQQAYDRLRSALREQSITRRVTFSSQLEKKAWQLAGMGHSIKSLNYQAHRRFFYVERPTLQPICTQDLALLSSKS